MPLLAAHYMSLYSAALIVLAGGRFECIISDGKSNVPDSERAELQGKRRATLGYGSNPEGREAHILSFM